MIQPSMQSFENIPVSFSASGDNDIYIPSDPNNMGYVAQAMIMPEGLVRMQFLAKNINTGDERLFTGEPQFSDQQGFIFEYPNPTGPYLFTLRNNEKLVCRTNDAVRCEGFLKVAQR